VLSRSLGNHTGYRQVKGTKASAQQILDLYAGLQQSYLTDFDMMLSGYTPSAEAVEAVGFIARDLKQKARANPGSFFWGIISPYDAACPAADLEKHWTR
jgi:pyridoxine kinase